MTTYTLVARNFNEDPLPTSGLGSITWDGYGSVVGSTPLDTADGDSSYIEFATTSPLPAVHLTGVTFRLVPLGATPPDPSTWTSITQTWSTRKANEAGLHSLFIVGPVSTVAGSSFSSAVGDSYLTTALGPQPAAWYANHRFGLPDTYYVMAPGAAGAFTNTFRMSQYTVTIEAPGETYLWNRRSDGLGRNNLWNLPKTRQSTVWNHAHR